MTTNYMNDGFRVINNDGDEETIQIPYNLNNVLVSEQDIIKLLDKFNVKLDKIHNINVFIESFTHKSYCKKNIYPQEILEAAKKELGNPSDLLELFDKSFERNEYFGDRVLKLCVSMYLYYRYPNENEGFMTRLQTKLEDKKNLPIMSKEIGLGKFFIISKSIENMNGRNLDKIHEDVFEAFIGALFLSNGFEPCCLLITNLLETLIDYSDKLYCDSNYKDILLKYHHTHEWKHPEYDIIYHEGPPHKRKYIIGVLKQDHKPDDKLENKFVGYGIGNSHRDGAQNGAKMALIIHGVLNDDQYTQSDIYYPPFDRILAGDTNVLGTQSEFLSNNKTVLHDVQDNQHKDKQDNIINKEEDDDDNNSVYSEKSV